MSLDLDQDQGHWQKAFLCVQFGLWIHGRSQRGGGRAGRCTRAPALALLPHPASCPPLFCSEGALLPCRLTGITFCACDHITQLVKFLVKMSTRTAEYDTCAT